MEEAFCNIVGPQIRRLRYNRGWSQAKFAFRLQLAGLDISRESLAKVEGQIHTVLDHELPFYATALGVGIEQLYPPFPSGKPIHDVVVQLRSRRKPTPSQGTKQNEHPTLFSGARIVNAEPHRISASAQSKPSSYAS